MNILNKESQSLSLAFKALSDPTRLRIVALLCSTDRMCVNAIAGRIGMTQPAISQHLKILKYAGIIEAEKAGLYVHYRINKAGFEGLIKKLTNLYLKKSKQKCVNCPEKKVK